VRSEEDVGKNLYSALLQFFQVFSEVAHNDFYIAGESYAGKYVPATAYHIHQENRKTTHKINLKGITIGDGAVDPISQFTHYDDLMYQIGLADERQAEVIGAYQQQIIEGIGQGDLIHAFRAFDELMNGDFYPHPTYFFNITGTNNYFNFLNPNYPANPYPQFLNLPSTRAAIHVGQWPFADYNATVELHLLEDWMRSVGPLIPTLLDNYKVMFYSGQVDIILGAPGTERFLKSVEWKGAKEYHDAPRSIWHLNNQVAGYCRAAGNLRQVIVLGAGHLLPLDQPHRAYDMMDRFIQNRPFSS